MPSPVAFSLSLPRRTCHRRRTRSARQHAQRHRGKPPLSLPLSRTFPPSRAPFPPLPPCRYIPPHRGSGGNVRQNPGRGVPSSTRHRHARGYVGLEGNSPAKCPLLSATPPAPRLPRDLRRTRRRHRSPRTDLRYLPCRRGAGSRPSVRTPHRTCLFPSSCR